MTPFKTIYARASDRKGGAKALTSLLQAADTKALANVSDDRVLSMMARCIFRSGFVWRVIEQKWPGFEAAFLEFDPAALAFQPDDYWDGLARDERIVRNPQKIKAVRDNARFVRDIAAEHGSFARLLAAWPAGDQIGLMALLSKRGSRLGGNTGQYFLRFIGWDAFILSRDVVAALRDAGLDIAETPTAKKDLEKIQNQFNQWRGDSRLGNIEISRVLAMSIGENYAPDYIRERGERTAGDS